jgi:DNA-binding beta-propeller fold protein YncE
MMPEAGVLFSLKKSIQTYQQESKRNYPFLPFFIIFFLFLLSHTPAYGIKLTKVTHLFDITYHFSQPSDVAVSKEGLIYVVDGTNHKIKVFNQKGKFMFSFGRKGSREGELLFPLGIGIGDSGNIYIADSGNHRVQIFTKSGSYLNHFTIQPGNGVPSDPTDVAVNEEGNRVYVVDNDNHYILDYDLPTLVLIDTYGSPGMEDREFRYPFHMALDKYNYLYIVDVINTRVQLLNPDGLFVTTIGGWGVEKGEFFRPKGLAIDRENRVYVSDSYMGVIQVFESTGDFHSAIGDYEKDSVKKFTTPTGIFIDNNNRLYVVEMFAEKVSVYSIIDE